MRLIRLVALSAIIAALFVGGCAQQATPPAETTTPESAAPESGAPGELDGAALVQTKCTQCHDLARVEQKQADAAGWEETVDRMVANGLVVTDEERQAIIDYLASGQMNQ